jgi:small-conductance mechanosensitive channel
MNLFGIRFIGLNEVTVRKLVLTLVAIAAIALLRLLITAFVRLVLQRHRNDRITFWTKQATSLAAFVLVLLAAISIWFDDPSRLGTVLGLATAGIAIAAQKAVTSFAGYLVIMRGKTFTVGDRIKMGGVQGDVIALGFLQTRILEMGQPPEVNEQEQPGMWVRERQFSGRIATVTNDKIFDEAVFNFSREFPYIWDEIAVLLPQDTDRARAEQILVDAGRETTTGFAENARTAQQRMQDKYGIPLEDAAPTAYWRMTDRGLELTLRYLCPEHGTRQIRDHITRTVLSGYQSAGIRLEVTQR